MFIQNPNQVQIAVDEEGNVTGEYATRYECHKGLGIPHLAIIVLLFNKKGELILHVRSRNKLGGGRYDCLAAHVLKGEDSESVVRRC